MWSPIHLKKQGNKNSVCVWGGRGCEGWRWTKFEEGGKAI